ncbi:MAG: DUF5670 family protein [Candidatus Limnocylindria bacterium]
MTLWALLAAILVLWLIGLLLELGPLVNLLLVAAAVVVVVQVLNERRGTDG